MNIKLTKVKVNNDSQHICMCVCTQVNHLTLFNKNNVYYTFSEYLFPTMAFFNMSSTNYVKVFYTGTSKKNVNMVKNIFFSCDLF